MQFKYCAWEPDRYSTAKYLILDSASFMELPSGCHRRYYLNVKRNEEGKVSHDNIFKRCRGPMLRAACRVKSPPAHTTGYPALFQRRFNQTKAEQAAGSEITQKFSEEEDERKKYELKPISRPLGVSEKPSEFAKGWKEKRDDLLDYDKHIQRRKHLWVLRHFKWRCD